MTSNSHSTPKITAAKNFRTMDRNKRAKRTFNNNSGPTTVEPTNLTEATLQPEQQGPAAAQIPNAIIADARQLIWHVCQLCNIITCAMSTYLSIESLCRDMQNCNMPNFVYMTLLHHEAAMLHDISFKLSVAADALHRTPEHAMNMGLSSYRMLLNAANRLPRFTAWIPAAHFNRMPFQGEVLQIRRYAGEAAVMMDGHTGQGIVGWKECWDDASPHDAWHPKFDNLDLDE